MSKKQLSSILILTLSACLLFGCSPNGRTSNDTSSAGEATSAPEDETSVTYYIPTNDPSHETERIFEWGEQAVNVYADQVLVLRVEFDSNGNWTNKTQYISDGSLSTRHEYEYDQNGTLTKWVGYNAKGAVFWNVGFQYDSNGNRTKWITYDADGTSFWTNAEYAYDRDGNQTTYIYYDRDGSVVYHYGYEYDDSGNQIRWLSYEADGSTCLAAEYTYDTNGNRTNEVRYQSDGSVSYRLACTYDGNGFLQSDARDWSDGTAVRHTYTYDQNGNQTSYTTCRLEEGTVVEEETRQLQWIQATEAQYNAYQMFSGMV